MFINNSKTFEEIKTFLRRAINYTDSFEDKASILHNLSVILYFECKTHNKIEDVLNNYKLKLEMDKKSFMGKRTNILQNIIREDDGGKVRLNKEDQLLLEKEKKELEEIKLSNNPMQDSNLKNSMSVFTEDIRKKEKLFYETRKFYDKYNNGEFEKPDTSVLEESLKNTRLPKNEKVDIMMYNLENYGDIVTEADKIIKNEVDYERDLNSILPNLFISIKFREMPLDIEDQEDLTKYSYLKNNLSSKMELHNFLLLYRPYFEFYSKNINMSKNKKSVIHIFKIEEELKKETEKYKNTKFEIVDPNSIEEFRDILEQDKFFTFIKNMDNLKSILFLAELFTENSRDFPEESDYWLKYAFTISLNANDLSGILRSLVLSAAYLIDNSQKDLANAELILRFIYDLFEDNKDKYESKNDISTYTMAIHLLGLIIKANPKEKGEGLLMIETAKALRKEIGNEEKSFFLNFERDYKYEMDYDQETIDYIDNN